MINTVGTEPAGRRGLEVAAAGGADAPRAVLHDARGARGRRRTRSARCGRVDRRPLAAADPRARCAERPDGRSTRRVRAERSRRSGALGAERVSSRRGGPTANGRDAPRGSRDAPPQRVGRRSADAGEARPARSTPNAPGSRPRPASRASPSAVFRPSCARASRSCESASLAFDPATPNREGLRELAELVDPLGRVGWADELLARSLAALPGIGPKRAEAFAPPRSRAHLGSALLAADAPTTTGARSAPSRTSSSVAAPPSSPRSSSSTG